MKNDIVEIKLKSKEYPELLRHIAGPPKQLYCRGNIELLNSECFAVVGTRAVTLYGREATQTIVSGLVRHFTIVSGMALGIDSVAHRAALEMGGRTIAVLGSGVDDKAIYPSTHLKLARDILAHGGLIISEYEPKTKARDFMFPERNRIVSGLSKGVLIIEADEKSGSLITARLAAEQNRDVFAVPGSIFSSKAMGPHKLIRTGAKLVTSANDVMEEYSHLPLGKVPVMSTSDPEHALIIAILEEHGPLHVDTIIGHAKQNPAQVMANLSLLEIQGHVKQMPGGIFRKAN